MAFSSLCRLCFCTENSPRPSVRKVSPLYLPPNSSAVLSCVISEICHNVQSVRHSSFTCVSGRVTSGGWTASHPVTMSPLSAGKGFYISEEQELPWSYFFTARCYCLGVRWVMICISLIKYDIKLIRKMRIGLSSQFLCLLLLFLFPPMLQGFFNTYRHTQTHTLS